MSTNNLDLLAMMLPSNSSHAPSLQETSNVVVEDEELVCPHSNCRRAFSSKRNLVDHFRGHHQGSKPHICTYPHCGKSFLRPAHKIIHMRTHTGEKPFVCEFPGCGKRWNQKSALKQHLRSHTGEKPFECPHCQKRFSTSSSCKRHILTHDKFGDSAVAQYSDNSSGPDSIPNNTTISRVSSRKRKAEHYTDDSDAKIARTTPTSEDSDMIVGRPRRFSESSMTSSIYSTPSSPQSLPSSPPSSSSVSQEADVNQQMLSRMSVSFLLN